MHGVRPRRAAVGVLLVLGLTAVMAGSAVGGSSARAHRDRASITKAPFGIVDANDPDHPENGKAVDLYTLKQRQGDGGQDHHLRRDHPVDQGARPARSARPT